MSFTTPTVRLPDRWSFFKMIATRFPGRMSLRFWPFIYVPFTLFCRLRAGIGVLNGFHGGSKPTKRSTAGEFDLKTALAQLFEQKLPVVALDLYHTVSYRAPGPALRLELSFKLL